MTLAVDDEVDELSNVKDLVEDAPIVKFVNSLISQAVQDRASDIHIEPTERDLRVRYRIDGVLHEVMKSPKSIQAGVISRLKIMAEMNIAEASYSARRPAVSHRHREEDRPSGGVAADRVGREDRHANPGQLDGAAEADRPRLRGR